MVKMLLRVSNSHESHNTRYCKMHSIESYFQWLFQSNNMVQERLQVADDSDKVVNMMIVMIVPLMS